jgi:hypothetical protein
MDATDTRQATGHPDDGGRRPARNPGVTAAPRRPLHLLVAAGAVSAAYAGSLAWVLALQAEADRALVAERQPVGHAIALLRSHHERMTERLDAAWDAYAAAADNVTTVADSVGELNTGLAGLASRVAQVEAVAGSIPQRINLPAVKQITTPKSKGSKPAPAAAPPPPANASSGASGG